MVKEHKAGFILPLSLVLGTGMLVLAVLAVRMESETLFMADTEILHLRAESSLHQNLAGLVDLITLQILHNEAASALVSIPDLEMEGVTQVLVSPDQTTEHTPLHSLDGTMGVLFQSGSRGRPLLAGLEPLNPGREGDRIQLSLAWTAEDMGLQESAVAMPSFWPLPGWDYAPTEEPVNIGALMDEATLGDWRAGPWIPWTEAFAMIPEASPSFVPVVRRLGVQFGIFASGNRLNGEKVIRIRYYLDGEIWNPYNRPLHLHPGSGLRAQFTVLFWNLPEVRIHNRSMGLSTEWIPLDAAENANSGARGIRGWIRTPGIMPSGGSLSFEEPDPRYQPEGLARTLHPGLLVRPADRIEIEFRQGPGGIYAACLPIEDEEPMEAALEGHGWHRIESFPAEWPELPFSRADEGDRPFLLEDGSLSFRRENTQIRLDLVQSTDLVSAGIDPRRRHFHFLEAVPDSSGIWHPGSRLLQLQVHNQLAGPEIAVPPSGWREEAEALFSWPEEEPETLRESMDLPVWAGGFRSGAAGASRLNVHLDIPGYWTGQKDEALISELIDGEGNRHLYTPSVPINSLSSKRWLESLVRSSEADPDNTDLRRFPVYPFINTYDDRHFQAWSMPDLEAAADSLVESIREKPAPSVSVFFDAGLPEESLPANSQNPTLHQLMPLRGWLGKQDLPRLHGSAWVLHVAIRGILDHRTIWKSARLWLLETQSHGGERRFEVIRFEPTQSESHFGLVPIPL